MSENKNRYKNDLEHYRRRMSFSQSQVLHMLGEGRSTRLWKLESGGSLPTLLTALKLSAIYRAPVEALYNDIYLEIRERVRNREITMPEGEQGLLPCFSV